MSKKRTLILSIAIIILIIPIYSYSQHINNRQVIENSHIVKRNNSNILSLMYETEVGSGEYVVSNSSSWPNEGYTFNERLSKCENSSELTWNDITKAVIFSGNITDKCYLYFDLVPPKLKYWNDDFNNSTSYYFPDTPSKTYNSLAELQAEYADFASNPVYIKTTATEHQACGYYEETEKEFCLGVNFWVDDSEVGGDGNLTRQKLQTEMAEALGINESDLYCNSESGEAYCEVSGFYCSVTSEEFAICTNNVSHCSVYGVTAYCY